jgi:glycosyltransferase involved in cell wall biosynthesis
MPSQPPRSMPDPAGVFPGRARSAFRIRGRAPTADSRHTSSCSAERSAEHRLCCTATSQPRITIFTRSYPPAYLAGGGPAQSVFALVEALADEFKFSVITSALDDPAAGPMDSVEPSRWSKLGHAMIWYELRHRMPARKVIALLRETKPQLVYVNSIFDYRFATLPLLVTRMISTRIPVVLAPRGELSAGALTLKRTKKWLFVAAFRMLGLHRAVSWHASTSQERTEIERAFGTGVKSHIAMDLRTGITGGDESPDRDCLPHSDPNGCSLVFFSRIVPKKNLATVIKAIPLVQGNVRLSIAGPIEDARYWKKCLALLEDIGDTESVTYIGTIPPEDVTGFLGCFDLFVLPTLGENFGHVVLESLAAGTPVIVGRDTPWQQIETVGAGWLCDPASPQEVAGLIQRFLTLDEGARLRMRIAAHNVATEVLNDPDCINANRAMFQALIRGERA